MRADGEAALAINALVDSVMTVFSDGAPTCARRQRLRPRVRPRSPAGLSNRRRSRSRQHNEPASPCCVCDVYGDGESRPKGRCPFRNPEVRDLRGERPGNTKTDSVVPDVRIVLVAIRRAQPDWIAEPGAAAENAGGIHSSSPSTAVCRRTLVTAMPGVFDPFPNIAADIMQPKSVSPEAACGRDPMVSIVASHNRRR